ncbi:MAG: hypothetical protein ABW166_05155 [Sedimenticola sp.]
MHQKNKLSRLPALALPLITDETTTTEITLDQEELEDARWFSREEVMQISRGDQEPGLRPSAYPAETQ